MRRAWSRDSMAQGPPRNTSGSVPPMRTSCVGPPPTVITFGIIALPASCSLPRHVGRAHPAPEDVGDPPQVALHQPPLYGPPMADRLDRVHDHVAEERPGQRPAAG